MTSSINYSHYERNIRNCPAGKTCMISPSGNTYVKYPSTKVSSASITYKEWVGHSAPASDKACINMCDADPKCVAAARNNDRECWTLSKTAQANAITGTSQQNVFDKVENNNCQWTKSFIGVESAACSWTADGVSKLI